MLSFLRVAVSLPSNGTVTKTQEDRKPGMGSSGLPDGEATAPEVQHIVYSIQLNNTAGLLHTT